jgi:hypothetical protein
MSNLYQFSASITGLQPVTTDTLPPAIRDALAHVDEHLTFGRMMAQAGASCTENYGVSVEGLEVWKLPDQAGWLVLHDDGDGIDQCIYVRSAADYMQLQARYVAPLAMKVM